jgi:hypothetical protein
MRHKERLKYSGRILVGSMSLNHLNILKNKIVRAPVHRAGLRHSASPARMHAPQSRAAIARLLETAAAAHPSTRAPAMAAFPRHIGRTRPRRRRARHRAEPGHAARPQRSSRRPQAVRRNARPVRGLMERRYCGPRQARERPRRSGRCRSDALRRVVAHGSHVRVGAGRLRPRAAAQRGGTGSRSGDQVRVPEFPHRRGVPP